MPLPAQVPLTACTFCRTTASYDVTKLEVLASAEEAKNWEIARGDGAGMEGRGSIGLYLVPQRCLPMCDNIAKRTLIYGQPHD